MAEPSIVLENVSKHFAVCPERAESLKTAAVQILRLRRPRRYSFWALRDISLTVMPGEVIGVIGENGAGKSTLISIISRILRPTTGTVHVRGRCSCLLEVGAAFHPELTGVENVYLYGAILGLRAAEIGRRLNEIIEFAEIGDFADVAVKTYSSGMVSRLGFAVAVSVDPDVLLVDEALAVGDEYFQRKCYARIADFCAQGDRAVVLVSHDLDEVRRLATRVAWLRSGRLAALGDPNEVIERYLVYTREVSEDVSGRAAG